MVLDKNGEDDVMKIWNDIEVTWNREYRYWEITGDNVERDSWEWLGHSDLKKHAVEDAMIYAFDTACGPARGKRVLIYTQKGNLAKTIEAV